MSGETFDKEKFYAFLALSKHHRERFERRRSYQWKINFALWGALGLLAGQIAVNKLALDPSKPWPLWMDPRYVLIAIGILYVFWTFGTECRHGDDRKLAKDTCMKAEELLGLTSAKGTKRESCWRKLWRCPCRMWRAFWGWRVWITLSQIGLTACLLVLMWLAVSGGFRSVGGTDAR